MFGRNAGHERGHDHVTRAFDAMDRGRGIDGGGQREPRSERESGERRGGKSRERSAGRERAGWESGRPERELDREPGGAGGSVRESGHGKAAGPTPKTPDVDLGVEIPLPASGRTTPTTPARTAATPACARPAEPGALAALDPAAAGATMIGQARRIPNLLVSGCGVSQDRQTRKFLCNP